MQQICGVSLYCPRGQCILILLSACEALGGGPSKEDCLAFIDANKWFNKDIAQDLPPYPGNTNQEPRWMTLFAWARQDAADHNCILRGQEGYWPITTEGRAILEAKKRFLLGNELAMQLMFLWTPTFKSVIHPNYQVSKKDMNRTGSIYKDDGRHVPYNIERILCERI